MNTLRIPQTQAHTACALALALVALLAGCATTPRPQPPQTGGADPSKPTIYDPQADGETQLAVALDRARRDGRRVLLNLGANWCSDSQKMFRLLQDDPAIADCLNRSYVLVLVDVNQREASPRNASLVARFGDPLARGIPVLLVLTAEGKLLNTDPTERLADSDHAHPDKVLDYLRRWSGVTTR